MVTPDESSMQPLTLRIPGPLLAQVKRIAERDDRTVSWVIRRAVTEYVAKKGRAR